MYKAIQEAGDIKMNELTVPLLAAVFFIGFIVGLVTGLQARRY